MPVTNETHASTHTASRSVEDRNAISVMATSSTSATVSRISFCGTRSATTPARRAGMTTPTALAVITVESWAGPPPRRMTSQTRATIHTPLAKELAARASASQR
jgi:hypothetical protein